AQLQPAYGKKMADRGYTQPGLSPYFYSNVKDPAQYRERDKTASLRAGENRNFMFQAPFRGFAQLFRFLFFYHCPHHSFEFLTF
ncbi:hypothetical protein, partial [Desulfatibacillum alkenivorans]|uniref:hypothetical protein n=1 Tax=Desulfatibacillum alkenivorans TaxID=259354 RepID=UPI001B8A920F